jgi:hypothetical protein
MCKRLRWTHLLSKNNWRQNYWAYVAHNHSYTQKHSPSSANAEEEEEEFPQNRVLPGGGADLEIGKFCGLVDTSWVDHSNGEAR